MGELQSYTSIDMWLSTDLIGFGHAGAMVDLMAL